MAGLWSTPIELASASIGEGSRDVGTVLVTTGLLIGAVILGGLILMWLRRRMTTETRGGSDATVMESLREMRDSGAISAEEYEAARQGVIERMRGEIQTGSTGAANSSGVAGVTKSPTRSATGLGRRLPGDSAVARPGFDLTGAPLPPTSDGEPPTTGEGPPGKDGGKDDGGETR